MLHVHDPRIISDISFVIMNSLRLHDVHTKYSLPKVKASRGEYAYGAYRSCKAPADRNINACISV